MRSRSSVPTRGSGDGSFVQAAANRAQAITAVDAVLLSAVLAISKFTLNADYELASMIYKRERGTSSLPG